MSKKALAVLTACCLLCIVALTIYAQDPVVTIDCQKGKPAAILGEDGRLTVTCKPSSPPPVPPPPPPSPNEWIATPLTLSALLGVNSPVKSGEKIQLQGGVYLGGVDTSIAGVTIYAAPGAKVVFDGAGIDKSVITTRGADTTWSGVEVINSSADRSKARPTGIDIFGPRTKILSSTIRDCGVGIGLWSPAVDAEVRECLIYRNGWQGPAPDRGHGHGVYVQNAEGSKRIIGNIIFNNYGIGVHAYAQAGELRGIEIERNVIFGNGSPAMPAGVDEANILISGSKPAVSIEVSDNVTHHAGGIVATNVAIDGGPAGNKELIVEGNAFIGGVPFAVQRWSGVKVSGNSLFAETDRILTLVLEGSTLAGEWDSNAYFTPLKSPFALHSPARNGLFDLAGWQSTTWLDKNSTLAATLGARSWVWPDSAGRAIVAVYRVAGQAQAEVSIASILPGASSVSVRRSADYFASPQSISVSQGLVVLSLSREFEVFILNK